MRLRLVALPPLVGVVLAACTSAGAARSGATLATTTAVVATTGGATRPTAGSTIAASTEPTGVPGLADHDPFCASWAAYSGTLQVIAVANAFGGLSSGEVARLEVISAASLVDAVEGIGSRWPASLVAERTAVLDQLVGPYKRRAEKALSAANAAGITDSDLAVLRAAWSDALHARDRQSPTVTVPSLPAALAAKVEAAAAAFDAAVTPFGKDPSLNVSGVTTPTTTAYLAQHCPDLATSGVGDAV